MFDCRVVKVNHRESLRRRQKSDFRAALDDAVFDRRVGNDSKFGNSVAI